MWIMKVRRINTISSNSSKNVSQLVKNKLSEVVITLVDNDSAKERWEQSGHCFIH